MPNWVHCLLTVTGEEDKLDDISSSMKDNETTFSFDRLCPRPPEEADNWYNWNVSNWGTKWNACRCELTRSEQKLVYNFDTAWAPPMPVIEKFAEKFSAVDFTFSYHEEQGWGGNLEVAKGALVKHDQYDIPETHRESIERRGWCFCTDDDTAFDDCFYQRALAESELTAEAIEAVRSLGPGWHGTFQELLEAVRRL
jgi:hypothetical protein